MCFAHYCFLKIGLIESHAIFASDSLIVAIFSLIILNENLVGGGGQQLFLVL